MAKEGQVLEVPDDAGRGAGAVTTTDRRKHSP
jgi:hypothetical protein